MRADGRAGLGKNQVGQGKGRYLTRRSMQRTEVSTTVMTSQLTIFIDDGGVMSDNELREPQWRRLVGEFLAPRLGGTQEALAEANRLVFEPLFREYEEMVRDHPDSDYLSYWDGYLHRWLRGMGEHAGVATPEGDECVRLAWETSAFVTSRVKAAYPGAVEAIRELRARGHTLHTASGGHSADLAGYLEAMGVRGLFDRLYGPDLVNDFKAGTSFYERIFADAAVEPRNALVVDDSPRCVGWAREVGATGVLVSSDSAPADGDYTTIPRLADLPSIVEHIERDIRAGRAPGASD